MDDVIVGVLRRYLGIWEERLTNPGKIVQASVLLVRR
jgi:hypothetical protein